MHHLSFLLLLLLPSSLASPNLTTPGSKRSSSCDASLEVCEPDSEFLVDSENNRRILGTSDYISYNALTADRVPCTVPKTPYGSCSASGAAHIYKPTCTVYTKCAKDTG